MTSLFLDANFVIALEVSDDQHYNEATIHWKNLIETPFSLVTTSYVFDEVVTYLNSRRQHDKAVSVGRNLLNAANIEVVQVDEPLFYEAWSYFEQHADKTYSLTDCVSFILMKRLRITEALTFDKHFVQAGFTKLPK
ncbi:MAG TPA: PIN domain-containing protein [Pyrinomonadaceae bacterium]